MGEGREEMRVGIEDGLGEGACLATSGRVSKSHTKKETRWIVEMEGGVVGGTFTRQTSAYCTDVLLCVLGIRAAKGRKKCTHLIKEVQRRRLRIAEV